MTRKEEEEKEEEEEYCPVLPSSPEINAFLIFVPARFFGFRFLLRNDFLTYCYHQ